MSTKEELQREESLQSMMQHCADITRWTLLIALKGGRVSADRKKDIADRARRIGEIAESL